MDVATSLGASVALLAQFAGGVLLSAWVLRRDTRRLSPEQSARAWNTASRWAALGAFGPLCLIVHFTRTRRSIRGLAVGLAWFLAVMVALSPLGYFLQ